MTQNAGKKCSENASKKVQNSKIFYSGEGEPHSPQTRPLGPRRDPAPPWKKASCASVSNCELLYIYTKITKFMVILFSQI